MGGSKSEPSARRRSQRLKDKNITNESNFDASEAVRAIATLSEAPADSQAVEAHSIAETAEVVESDEEGPEDVSLSTSRLVSMETRRLEQDQKKRVEATVREKRRKRHELFSSQKMSKTITKFPEEALADISLKLAEQTASKKTKKRLNKKLKRLQKPSLPIEALHDSIRVVALTEHSGADSSGGAIKEDFRKHHFYGDRLKRLPILTIQAKKYRNLPAKNFVKSALCH